MTASVVVGRVFFFKQKTAYEKRISDWSSDVCSSDLMVVSSVTTMAAAPHFSARCRKLSTSCSSLDQYNWYQRGAPGDTSSIAAAVLSIGALAWLEKIGRASCRERVCQYV